MRFVRGMATQARAMVYYGYGEPMEKMRVFNHTLNDPTGKQVLLKLLACPINPSDINQVQGVYPAKPKLTTELGSSEPCAVGGNEGVFEVIKVGEQVKSLKVGDWALPQVGNFGTWRSHALANEYDFNAIKDHSKITPVQASTVSVNPATAYQILHQFTDLKQGDWFIQNGANSGVGRSAIQIGRLLGINSINVVRNRENLDELKSELEGLGATHVITDEQLSDKSFRAQIKEWIGDKPIKLAMNCVGGKNCTNMIRQLSPDGHVVTYGGMSKQPVTIGTGDLIFKNIHAHGYWLSAWAAQHPEKRYELILKLLDLMGQGQLKDIPAVKHNWNEGAFLETFQTAMDNSLKSKGKQVMVYDNKS